MLLLSLTQMGCQMPKVINYYQEILAAADDVFGSRVAARVWLSKPNPLLGEDTPFDHAVTSNGAHMVLGILKNMKDGFSY